jgi:hypothetical protein
MGVTIPMTKSLRPTVPVVVLDESRKPIFNRAKPVLQRLKDNPSLPCVKGISRDRFRERVTAEQGLICLYCAALFWGDGTGTPTGVRTRCR